MSGREISDSWGRALAGDQHYCAHDDEENAADEFHYMGGKHRARKAPSNTAKKALATRAKEAPKNTASRDWLSAERQRAAN